MGLNNLGDDVLADGVMLAEKLFQAIMEIIKMMKDNQKNGLELENLKMQNEHLKKQYGAEKLDAKITFGEMNRKEFEAIKGIENLNVQYVPKESLPIIAEYSEKLGAKYFTLEDYGDVATVVVPDKYIAQFNNVLKAVAEKQLNADKDSLIVMNNENLIKGIDKDLADDVMDYYGLPVYKFDVGEDRMNIVPKEYKGRYDAALEEMSKVKAEMKGFDIEVFNQTQDLNTIDYGVLEVTAEQAECIAALDSRIELYSVNDAIEVKFPAELKESIDKTLEGLASDIEKANEYELYIVDENITINKSSLVVSENANEYFTKIPNTGGKDFMKIDKSDVELIDDGKTIKMKLDYNKNYPIYDENGELKNPKLGSELAEHYNTKNVLGNKNTEITHHFNDNLQRIELYHANTNQMMSIGIENSDKVRSLLLSKNIPPYAAEKIMENINSKMPESYKEIFDLKAKENTLSLNIPDKYMEDMLKQGKVAQKLASAKNVSVDRFEKGTNCCMYDMRQNQYVILNSGKNVEEALKAAGYSGITAHCVSNKIVKEYSDNDFVPEKQNVKVMEFDTQNVEVAKLRYIRTDDSIIITKPEINGDKPQMNNIIISNGADRRDIEKAIQKGLEIKDNASVAECMMCMDKIGFTDPVKVKTVSIENDTVSISKVSSNCISVEMNDKQLIMENKNISVDKVAAEFGLKTESAEKIAKLADKSVNAKAASFTPLNKLKANAAKEHEKLKAAEGKSVDMNKSIETIERVK